MNLESHFKKNTSLKQQCHEIEQEIIQLNTQGIQIKNEYDEIDHQMNEGQLTLQNLKE
jgi:HPt (histidine-containing phosphotransfer) domain-containing protein